MKTKTNKLENPQEIENTGTEEIPEIIVVENPEVIDADQYIGEIKTVHDGYVFLYRVKHGYQTVDTCGDVFSPVSKEIQYEAGQMIQFPKLNRDPERPGKFRTQNIEIIRGSSMSIEKVKRVTDLARLSKKTGPYHNLKKQIKKGDLEKVKENKPLAIFMLQLQEMLNKNPEFDPGEVSNFADLFLRSNFSLLAFHGISFSIHEEADPEEPKKVEQAISEYIAGGLDGQAESLKTEYKSFSRIRAVFNLMASENNLHYDTVLSLENLPELTYALPVWYIWDKKNGPPNKIQSEDDPLVDSATRFFADCVGSKEYAWFLQIYNRRNRNLSLFKGKDIMPPNLVMRMKKAKKIFDRVVIMTPYHDQASREWSDPDWLRNIDPLLVGFLEGTPFMFILGRWSQTGTFPLFFDFIADTTNHLRLNKHLLTNFNESTYWYKGDLGDDNDMLGIHLEAFVDRLLEAYDRGKVFEFLRGELSGENKKVSKKS